MGSARIQYIRENQGFDLVAMEYLFPSVDLLERHYEEHKGKSFFRELVDFMTSGMLESNRSTAICNLQLLSRPCCSHDMARERCCG
jgi:hypothetical protein